MPFFLLDSVESPAPLRVPSAALTAAVVFFICFKLCVQVYILWFRFVGLIGSRIGCTGVCVCGILCLGNLLIIKSLFKLTLKLS